MGGSRSPALQGGLERLLGGLIRTLDHALEAETVAARPGLLQGLDPRIKVVGLGLLILSTLWLHTLTALAALFLLATALALASHIGLRRLALQVWLGVLLFSGAIALPALVLVPGQAVAHLPGFDAAITRQGLRSATFLLGRAETAATLVVLLILTTPWTHVLKALRALGVPVVVVALLGMTHRYIFVLLDTAVHLFEARRSRLLGPLPPAEGRRLAASAAGVLLSKSLHLAGEVHLAMISRGYLGEVRLLHDFRTRPRDWLALTVAACIPLGLIWGMP